MSSSKVMALMPAYNSAGFIQQTLDSLSAQTRPNFEVLISVYVCEDNTFDVCKAYCERDPRFQVMRQEGDRLEYAGNCNFLMNQAEADYVNWLRAKCKMQFHFSTRARNRYERLGNFRRRILS